MPMERPSTSAAVRAFPAALLRRQAVHRPHSSLHSFMLASRSSHDHGEPSGKKPRTARPDSELHGREANTLLGLFTTSLLLRLNFDRSIASSAGRQCRSHCASYYLSLAYSRGPRAKARVRFGILRIVRSNTWKIREVITSRAA